MVSDEEFDERPDDPKDPDYVPPDVFLCDYCLRPFTKLGDKFRHIASEHKSEPAPESSLPREG